MVQNLEGEESCSIHLWLREKLKFDFGYTHLFIDDADINVTVPIAGGAGTDTLVGEYEDPEVDIISLQAVYKF